MQQPLGHNGTDSCLEYCGHIVTRHTSPLGKNPPSYCSDSIVAPRQKQHGYCHLSPQGLTSQTTVRSWCTIQVHQSKIKPCSLDFPAGFYWYGSRRPGPGCPLRWTEELADQSATQTDLQDPLNNSVDLHLKDLVCSERIPTEDITESNSGSPTTSSRGHNSHYSLQSRVSPPKRWWYFLLLGSSFSKGGGDVTEPVTWTLCLCVYVYSCLSDYNVSLFVLSLNIWFPIVPIDGPQVSL